MLQSVSNSPIQLFGIATERDETKQQLPSRRTRDTICGLGTSNKPFAIRPHPESPYDQSVTLNPVRIIGRSQLPLTFLDTTPDEHFATNSLFSTHIDALEDVHTQEGNGAYEKVLIARFEAKRTLYAIERVQTHVYSIHRLANWLKERDVADLWDPANLQEAVVIPRLQTSISMGGDWWQHAVAKVHSGELPPRRAKMTMMRPKSGPHTTAANQLDTGDSRVSQEAKALDTAPTDIANEPFPEIPSPRELLPSLVEQYLDAVYLSKTSLAYFAKGPITRIRNAFTSPDEGAPATHELVTFLRTMLLSPKASEVKYYDKLPAVIKALPPGSYSDEEPTAIASKAKKSKKKMKLSREGVYPHEEAVIKRWWLSELPSGENMGTETVDQRIRRRVGDLRVRETLAQLIIMLEIVALEALSTYKPSLDDKSALEGNDAQEGQQPKSKKRVRKLDDINLQLDLLLDKLCIWHATEELGILDFDAKPSRQIEGHDGPGRNDASDRLHSFCVEVIIPFYMNRLPEQALMANKKLGGPVHTTPPKRKSMKAPNNPRKSGVSNEPEAKKSRRSLARVATDTTGRTIERVTPGLHRSATDSALMHCIKREGSEVPLSAIPFQRSPSKSARQSMSQIRHLQGRQIDLNRPSAAAEAKIKHKQRVDEDLQEAILALKKPNRGLAAGGYVIDKEQRGLGQAHKSRKPANPVRNIIKDVQVSATPRVGRRTKNMIEQTPTHDHHQNPFMRAATADGPPSSGFCIPSSAARPSYSKVSATLQGSAAGRSLVHSSIAETPSKAPNTKTFSSGAARRMIFATPTKATVDPSDSGLTAPSHVFETPVKVAECPPFAISSSMPPAILTTPTKPLTKSPTMAVPVAFSLPAKSVDEPSIYDALGWNDEDDDDLM